MKLSTARLCLDCNEVYEEGGCPACGSETFAYLTRWVPSAEKRPQPRPSGSPTADVYRGLLASAPSPSRRNILVANALVGTAAIGMLGWLWQKRPGPKSDDQTTEPLPSNAGEKTSDSQ